MKERKNKIKQERKKDPTRSGAADVRTRGPARGKAPGTAQATGESVDRSMLFSRNDVRWINISSQDGLFKGRWCKICCPSSRALLAFCLLSFSSSSREREIGYKACLPGQLLGVTLKIIILVAWSLMVLYAHLTVKQKSAQKPISTS